MVQLKKNNFYWLNEEQETEEEKIERLSKEKIEADKLLAEQKVKEEALIKEKIMEDILKSPEFLQAVNAAAEEKIKNIDQKVRIKESPKDELKEELKKLNDKLKANEDEKLLERKKVIADKFSIDISDLEGFTNIKALESLAPKLLSKAEDLILKKGEYIKKSDTPALKAMIESLNDDTNTEKVAKINSDKTLAKLKSIYK